jgi:hypothetical protein
VVSDQWSVVRRAGNREQRTENGERKHRFEAVIFGENDIVYFCGVLQLGVGSLISR